MAREKEALSSGPEGTGRLQDLRSTVSELTGQSEVLNPNSVEVRFGDPMKDAPRLLQLYTQPSTVEHLEGIVPMPYKEIVIETDSVTQEKREIETGKEIPATTVGDIRKMYENPRITLLMAETPKGLIVGSCAVEKLSPNVAEIGKLVVARNYRRKHIGNMLIGNSNAFIFREGSGGLDCRLSQIFVIIGIPSYHIAQDAFAKAGYLRQGERQESTRSWSNDLGRVVDRNSQPMTLQRESYKILFPGAHEIDFPKQRLPKAT